MVSIVIYCAEKTRPRKAGVENEPPMKNWDRHEIKAEVHRRGATLLEIAIAAGAEPSSTRVALRRRNRCGEMLIAAFLCVPPQELWPTRYSGEAQSNEPQSTAPMTARSSRKRGGN